MSLLGLLGVAACFSAREDGMVKLPFDPATGTRRPAVWQRWLDWDPVRIDYRYPMSLTWLCGRMNPEKRGWARITPDD